MYSVQVGWAKSESNVRVTRISNMEGKGNKHTKEPKNKHPQAPSIAKRRIHGKLGANEEGEPHLRGSSPNQFKVEGTKYITLNAECMCVFVLYLYFLRIKISH